MCQSKLLIIQMRELQPERLKWLSSGHSASLWPAEALDTNMVLKRQNLWTHLLPLHLFIFTVIIIVIILEHNWLCWQGLLQCLLPRTLGLWMHAGLWAYWASLVAQRLKSLPTMQETSVPSLGWEDPLEKGKATHSIFWSGEFHGLYSTWGRKESDTTEWLSLYLHITKNISHVGHA